MRSEAAAEPGGGRVDRMVNHGDRRVVSMLFLVMSPLLCVDMR